MEVVEGRATVDAVDAFLDELGAIGDRFETAIQAFDARYVVDRAHLELAVTLANRAHGRDDAIADDRAVEFLVYAAGRRQIDAAIEMGISTGTGPVVVVVDGGDEPAAATAVAETITPADTLGRFDESLVRAYFDICDAEVSATTGTVADLVRERVALLPVEK